MESRNLSIFGLVIYNIFTCFVNYSRGVVGKASAVSCWSFKCSLPNVSSCISVWQCWLLVSFLMISHVVVPLLFDFYSFFFIIYSVCLLNYIIQYFTALFNSRLLLFLYTQYNSILCLHDVLKPEVIQLLQYFFCWLLFF